MIDQQYSPGRAKKKEGPSVFDRGSDEYTAAYKELERTVNRRLGRIDIDSDGARGKLNTLLSSIHSFSHEKLRRAPWEARNKYVPLVDSLAARVGARIKDATARRITRNLINGATR